VIRPTKFYFVVPPDVAWQEIKGALAPLGVIVTSEAHRTLLIERRSPLDAVEFKLAVRACVTREGSVLVLEEASVFGPHGRRHRHRFRMDSDPRGWPRGWLEVDLYEELFGVIQTLIFGISDPLSRLRTVEFRLGSQGYNVDEVDEFLDGLADKLERNGELLFQDVIHDEFRLGLKGYKVDEVDEFLDGLADKLERNGELFPQDVIHDEFGVGLKGYNTKEVDAFLRHMAAAIETQSRNQTKRDECAGTTAI
jgi:DivIVA domain-containing protein